MSTAAAAAADDSTSEEKPETTLAAISPIEISEKRKRLVNFASWQELNPDDRDIGFSARVFAQVSLPYRDPKDAPYWERRNGDTILTVRPALLTKPDGDRYTAYPFGLIPRQALTWMATEAYMTKSPELELGRSMNAFMEKLDLAHNGKNARRLTNHLQRLFGSQLSVDGLAITEEGHGSVTNYFQIADSVQLWFSNSESSGESNPGLWSSKVRLSDQFFQSILDAPIPVDLNAMKVLGSSPMRLDLYLWLSYRMSYLRDTTRVTWSQLNAQFGSQYTRLRAFKEAFLDNLADVRIVYPELNVEVHRDFIELRRSKTHVPKIAGAKRAKLQLLGDKFPENIDPQD